MANNTLMISRDNALIGRSQSMPTNPIHTVNGSDITAPPTSDQQQVLLGMGCFWGAERLFWQLPGVLSTAVGYAGGYTPNPTYQEVCSGETGHTEVVKVRFDPAILSFEQLLMTFWQRHDPTQGMRQGNDRGTQYRSAIYTFSELHTTQAIASKHHYQQALSAAHHNALITTEIQTDVPFYFAEEYHQQYLAKHPDGYCGLAGTGIGFPS